MRINEFGGLDNVNPPTSFGLGRLAVATNVSILDDKSIKTRQGVTPISESSISAAWVGESIALYVSASGSLHTVNAAMADSVVATGLTPMPFLFAHELDDRCYWSNRAQSGVIVNGASRSIGIQTPELHEITISTGLMPDGIYHYTITLTRADGYESGAPASGSFSALGGASVALNVEVPDGCAYATLYMTTANGDVMYRAASSATGELRYFSDTSAFMVPLRNYLCEAPPVFNYACEHNGTMLYAVGNTLYQSLPHNYEMVYALDFLQFDGAITMLASVGDGFYLSAGGVTRWISGGPSLHEMASSRIMKSEAIDGAFHVHDADVYGKTGICVTWTCKDGICAGFSGGSASNITLNVFAPGAFNRGAVGITEDSGSKHIVSTLS